MKVRGEVLAKVGVMEFRLMGRLHDPAFIQLAGSSMVII